MNMVRVYGAIQGLQCVKEILTGSPYLMVGDGFMDINTNRFVANLFYDCFM